MGPRDRTLEQLKELDWFLAFGRRELFGDGEHAPSWPVIPPDAPGLPPPGPDFVAEANRIAPEYAGDRAGWPGAPATYPELCWLALRSLYGRFWSRLELPVLVKGTTLPALMQPGGLLCREGPETPGGPPDEGSGSRGPVRSPVLLVGKHPGNDDIAVNRTFYGKAHEPLRRALADLGVPPEATGGWYATNLCRYFPPDPAKCAVDSRMLKNSGWLFWQELLLVRPKLVVCLGSEAAKFVLGKHANVGNQSGLTSTIRYRVPPEGALDLADFGSYVGHEASVIVTPAAPAVYRDPDLYPQLKQGIRRVVQVAFDRVPEPVRRDHRLLRNLAELRRAVDDDLAALAGAVPVIAVDAEWDGRHPDAPGARLRMFQWSCAAGTARGFTPTAADGSRLWSDADLAAAVAEFRRLLTAPDGRAARVGGHFFKADLPWIRKFLGLDLTGYYRAPESRGPRDKPWLRAKSEGGWDTAYMANAVYETGDLGLKDLAVLHADYPAYDGPIEAWKTRHCSERGILKRQLEGYGACPDDVLVPYGLHDADATRTLVDVFDGVGEAPGLLDRDRYGRNSRRPCWILHRAAALALLEMEAEGMLVDQGPVDVLTERFGTMRDLLAGELKDRIAALGEDGTRWDDFNPRSAFQVRELFFGAELNGKKDAEGNPVRLRPEGAATLGLTPVKTTGKPPESWANVVERGHEALYLPATDKESLGILMHQTKATDPAASAVIQCFRDLQFVSKQVSTTLRPALTAEQVVSRQEKRHRSATNYRRRAGLEPPPALDLEGLDLDDDVYDGGLLISKHHDGRIRSRFYLTETGRWTSVDANLQNLGKRREDDFARIFGRLQEVTRPDGSKALEHVGSYTRLTGRPLYDEPLRSVLRADPGHVLLEFDLQVAEVAALAWLSNDPAMMEDVRLSMLPDGHPEKLDIHCKTAIQAFKLDCEPTKKALEKLGRAGLRVAAKNVRFGVPYGRGAVSISRQCLEEGTVVSIEDCQGLIDGYHAMYPLASRYLAAAQARVLDPGYMVGVYGRIRRFPPTSDYSLQSSMQRAATNFPIQNAVADYISLLCAELMLERETLPGRPYRMALQIHDALMLHVRADRVEETWAAVRRAMARVPLYPADFDGNPLPGRGPYYFGVDADCYINWGVKPTAAQKQALRLPELRAA